jgi:hypothetical protein
LGSFDLADCEIKSNWIRNEKERAKKSPFLFGLSAKDREQLMLPNFYRRRAETLLDGLKVWPEGSPLVAPAKDAWEAYKSKTLPKGEGL